MNRSKVSLIIAVVLLAFTSCVKKDYDNPPSTNVDPDISANKTIASLKTLANSNGTLVMLSDNIIISGIINSDDQSGNIYKQIIFQDSTAGISINVDMSNLYTLFPKGRKIFVKCKGLYIAYVKGVVQLGVLDNSGTQPALGRIPQGLLDQYILRGVWGQPVIAKVVPLASVKNYNRLYENELITLNDVEFAAADSGKPYADALLQNSLIRYVEDCSGNRIEVYTSGYATFATTLTPGRKGSITAVYIGYQGFGNPIPELIIDKLKDIQMDRPRCGAAQIGTGSLMSLSAIRNDFNSIGTGIFVPGTRIRGTVISDLSTANINSFNLILQDGLTGTIVRFTATNTFSLNDSIEIDLTGDSLVSYQSGMEINYVTNSQVTLLGTGSLTPKVVTDAYVLANLATLESTLIKINSATLSGTGTFSGSVNITDATGTVIMYTRSGATFATTPYTTGTVSVTGFLSNFNGTPELILRSAADVQ